MSYLRSKRTSLPAEPPDQSWISDYRYGTKEASTMSRQSESAPRKSESAPRKSMNIEGNAYKDHQFRSPYNTGPRPTPTIPDGGKFSIYAETQINTPPYYPYEALVDIHSWREWNSFNPDVLITKHPNPHSRALRMEQGTFMTMTVQMTPTERTQSKEVCRHLEPLKTKDDGNKNHAMGGNITRIRWVMDNANLLAPGFIMKSERVNEIEECADGTTKYRTWITFGGMSAKQVKKKYEKALMARLPEFCQDLKDRAEKMYREKDSTAVGGAAKTLHTQQAQQPPIVGTTIPVQPAQQPQQAI